MRHASFQYARTASHVGHVHVNCVPNLTVPQPSSAVPFFVQDKNNNQNDNQNKDKQSVGALGQVRSLKTCSNGMCGTQQRAAHLAA